MSKQMCQNIECRKVVDKLYCPKCLLRDLIHEIEVITRYQMSKEGSSDVYWVGHSELQKILDKYKELVS